MEKTFLCGYGKKKIDLEIFLMWHKPDHMYKKDVRIAWTLILYGSLTLDIPNPLKSVI